MAATSGSTGGSSSFRKNGGGFVLSDNIGLSDILFGRGPAINDNPGNVAFRSFAASRKTEYLGANTNKEKNRIAREIVAHVRHHVNPPGRFLTMADKDVVGAMGFPDDAEVWCAVDDKTVLEKTKQTLRQIKKWGGAEQRASYSGKGLEPSVGSEESRRNGEHGTIHVVAGLHSSAQASGMLSSTNVGETSSDERTESMPPIANPEALAIGANDASLDTDHTISFANTCTAMTTAGVLEVAPAAVETLIPARWNPIQAQDVGRNIRMPSARPTNAGRGMPASGTMGQNIEIGEEGALDHQRSSLLKSIRIACELVKTIREGHDTGIVAYGSDICVDSSDLSGERIRRDLVSLGINLYRHFVGTDPFDSNTGTSTSSNLATEDDRASLEGLCISEATQAKKKERRSIPRKYVLLRDLGLPVSLCILVSCLLDAEDEGAADRYETADEVEEDLSWMMADPERYLFDAGADRLKGQLVFPGDRLYDREHHASCMIGAFDRVAGSTSGPREMLLISGYSGTGKSALVEQVRGLLLRKNGYLISGKFDQLGQAQPMSVIFDAFNEYCNDIAEGNGDTRSQIRREIQEALGSHGNVLTDLIPNLIKVVGEASTEAVQIGGREALNRFVYYFGLFVRAISSPSHPVILFLDDLQWADKPSLELISTIFSDCNTTSLLFIGCYRDNEVGIDHPLTTEVGKLALTGNVSISNIKLENIDRKSVNAMVSDALCLSPRLTWPLGDIVYNKTGGNPLFAVQFLRSLCDDKLLRYSASSRRWEWDAESIQSKEIADNVVDLMKEKMLKLDPEVEWLLKAAACLGSRFEPSTLQLLDSNATSDELNTIFLLDTAVREGLMCKLGSVYKFSHDQIQQAAYSLIPSCEREALHLRLGRSLWKRTSEEEQERLVFVVVDQLQRGSSLISGHGEKVEVARLCLTAGEKVMSSFAFSQALIYLLQGSLLLQESDWEDHYDLSLRLFSCCAEAQYAIGNFDGLAISVNPIFTHGKCLQDKLWAITNHLRGIGGQGKLLDAVDFGLDVLAQLGEPFPSEVNEEAFKLDFAKTREMCEGTTIDGLLKKERMHDPSKVAAMKLLVVVSNHAFQVNQYLCLLMVQRMVQLTMRHGVCQESPFALVTFGSVLCSCGELEQGYSYAKVALSLLHTLEAKEQLARVYGVAYNLIIPISEPLQSILPPLIHGYETGISTGDIEYGLTCAQIYCTKCVVSGRKLEPLADEVQKYVRQMQYYKQNVIAMATLPVLQAILNLTGNAEDPTKLTGEAMDQDEFLTGALEKQHRNVVHMVYFVRLWLAYFFRRYDVAAEMAQHHRNNSRREPLRLNTAADLAFYTGLIAIEKARSGEANKWRSIACESLEKLKVWADNSAWNFEHKLKLLNAEMAYLNCDRDGAADAYDNAIRVAREHGFIHEQALACERAGLFHSAVGTSAAEYFERAHTCYLEWGAVRKARDLFHEHLST